MVYTHTRFSTESQTTPEQVVSWVKSLGYQENSEEFALTQRAFEVADEAHGGQMRASGEPYITHAMAVAEILVQLHLDPAAVAAAILHDVVEDTDVSYEDIQAGFGDEVAHLVDGVTVVY
jgi:(p)ppGpp synthase/HD superfamily hydrolase